MRVLILVALLACDGKSDRPISKQMDMTNPSTGNTQTCVEGEEAPCTHAGGRWTGGSAARCCLPKSTCNLGDESTCARANGAWTGKYCCVR